MSAHLKHASYVIARLMAAHIFSEWEAMSRDHIIALIEKYNRELSLDITATTVFTRMEEFGIIRQVPWDKNYYSTK